nr:MAG TPA: hypothetical protein [Caudoviricetes sp.]
MKTRVCICPLGILLAYPFDMRNWIAQLSGFGIWN